MEPIDKICIYDLCDGRAGKNYYADIWTKDNKYYIGVMDGDNRENCGIFKIAKQDYLWLLSMEELTVKKFHSIYKNYKKCKEY